MAPKTRVVMNRDAFGKNVMAGPAVTAAVEAVAKRVAEKVPGGSVNMSTSPVRGGGVRVRAHVSNGSSDLEEARTNNLTRALFGTVGGGK